MSRIWVISDTHFGHGNIIKYSNRPFNSTQEMDNEMIKRWNDVVSKDDTIFHLGDFALTGKDRKTELLSLLNGSKILIKGNHDHGSSAKYREYGFKEVYKYPILYLPNIILSHQPVEFFSGFNIHGHSHEHAGPTSRHFNVSVEQINYAPILLDQLINKIVKEWHSE